MVRAWLSRLSARLLKNDLIRRVVRNSAYLFSATGLSAGMGMLQGILAARLLGVYGFGLLGTITMFTSVVNKLASFRMNELVVKYVGQYTEEGRPERAAAVFKTASLVEILTSVFAYLVVFLAAPLAARIFAKDPAVTTWFQVYGLIVLANLMAESATGFLQIFDRFQWIAVLNVLQSLATLLIISGIFFYYEFLHPGGDAILPVILAYLVGKTLGALGLTGAALFEATRVWGRGWWRAPINSLRAQARELIGFGINTNLSATINLVNKDAEILWVSFFRGPLEAGYYKLALALANIVQMPVAPLPQATYPELAREVSRSRWDNMRAVLRQGSQMAGGYSVLTTTGLILFGTLLIRIVYGAEYLPAYPALIILLVGFLFANTFYWNRIALLALGQPGYPTRVNLIAAILKIGLAFMLIPRYGYLGSAALLSGYYVFSITLNVRKTIQILRRQPAQELPA
jgi:O-antigen/teichoic acid export membrane protein